MDTTEQTGFERLMYQMQSIQICLFLSAVSEQCYIVDNTRQTVAVMLWHELSSSTEIPH